MRNIYTTRPTSGTPTRQRRFYILITALVCALGVRDGYGLRYFDDNGICTMVGTQCIKDGSGLYETKALEPYGNRSAQCASLNGDTCAFCGTNTDWNNRYELCRDNECPTSNTNRYQAGDYTKAADGKDGTFLICEPGSGWVLVNYEPEECIPSACQSTEWTKYNDTTEVMTARWCEEIGTYKTSCMATTRYQCIKNYYGYQEGEGTPITCTPCPSSPDPMAKENTNGTITSTGQKFKGLTEDKGADSISECYISAVGGSGGVGYIDGTGVYHFVNDCFYG